MERGTSCSFQLPLKVFFAALLAIKSSAGVSSTRAAYSESPLDYPKMNERAIPPRTSDYLNHYADDGKTDGKDLEQGLAPSTHDNSLDEHDPDDRFLEASAAEAAWALNMTSDLGSNYTSNVIVVHNETWDGTGDNETLSAHRNPDGNSSTFGNATKEYLGNFQTLIKNTVTRLVQKEIGKISYVYKKYFALLYNVSLADINENVTHDEPSNIIELVEEALTLDEPKMPPECKVTIVTVQICTIRVFHIGSLPPSIVENYNEDSLQGVICPCPVPVPGFLCPIYARHMIQERYDKRCRE